MESSCSERCRYFPAIDCARMRLWEIMFCARINKAAVRRWVSLAGGPLSKLPVFTAAEPKRNPVLTLAQFRQCASQYIFRWREGLCRFPPYQYRRSSGFWHRRRGWSTASVNQREVCLGYPRNFTLLAAPKQIRKSAPKELEDLRLPGTTGMPL